jgi:ATP-dependent RNA helicase SUPV3L1/SUV3
MRENMKASKVKHIIDERLDILGASLGKTHSLQTLCLDHNELEIFLAKFRTNITIDPGHSHVLPSSFAKIVTSTISAPQSDNTKTSFGAFETLQQVFVEKGLQGLDLELKHAFIGFVTDSRTTKPVLEKQVKIADLRYPFEWFPATRAKRRTIHLHVGPTNSGKTYHALKRLEQAGTGLYAGPLRLLAHEVYTRLNAKGKPCNLITGEEKRVIEGVKKAMISCTVEMTPINVDLEVAVIDEIQMIGSTERGWAWTQAFLGVKAKEVHLCGEERVVPLIQQLAALMGESLEIHRYTRLSPLEVGNESLKGNLHALEKGDCVVLFSRVGIHAMKQEIEKKTGKRCAVVYGRLPPETRAQQARLFNDPDSGYDILVASDAIGMGLNLSVVTPPTCHFKS